MTNRWHMTSCGAAELRPDPEQFDANFLDRCRTVARLFTQAAGDQLIESSRNFGSQYMWSLDGRGRDCAGQDIRQVTPGDRRDTGEKKAEYTTESKEIGGRSAGSEDVCQLFGREVPRCSSTNVLDQLRDKTPEAKVSEHWSPGGSHQNILRCHIAVDDSTVMCCTERFTEADITLRDLSQVVPKLFCAMRQTVSVHPLLHHKGGPFVRSSPAECSCDSWVVQVADEFKLPDELPYSSIVTPKMSSQKLHRHGAAIVTVERSIDLAKSAAANQLLQHNIVK